MKLPQREAAARTPRESLTKRALQAAYRRLLKPLLRPIFRDFLLTEPIVFGARERVRIAPTAFICNALLNTNSGTISIEDFVFFGTGVALLAGTHDYTKFLGERMESPDAGYDIVIRRGAWIATNAVIVGPRIIGEHAVVAAGAVVVHDVPPYSIVAGIPARIIGSVSRQAGENRAA